MKRKTEFIYPLGELKLRRSENAFAAGEIAFGRPADLDARAKQPKAAEGEALADKALDLPSSLRLG